MIDDRSDASAVEDRVITSQCFVRIISYNQL